MNLTQSMNCFRNSVGSNFIQSDCEMSTKKDIKEALSVMSMECVCRGMWLIRVLVDDHVLKMSPRTSDVSNR